jgi:nitroimidazol reductase NimA-like FMN-containing flavoprotein (pyridoxamine 5'-phosphate oxidase superfamily)
MPSRRDLIRMSEAEIDAYVDARHRVVLVTNGPEGMPHPVPMEFGRDEDGRVILTSFRKSQKVKNLERDPRATLLWESGGSYHELQGVIAYCNAELIYEPGVVQQLMRKVRTIEVLAGSISPAMSEQVRASLAKRVIVRLTPYRFISWDHRKLGAVY